jgi:hypothetical protein
MSAAETEGRNTARADAAHAALAAYCRSTGADANQTGLIDLIADCGHLARRKGWGFVGLLEKALRHWAAELRHPDGLEAATSVPQFETICTPAPRHPRGRRIS